MTVEPTPRRAGDDRLRFFIMPWANRAGHRGPPEPPGMVAIGAGIGVVRTGERVGRVTVPLMSVWYEGSSEIQCSLEQVKRSIGDYGELLVGVVSLLPGLKNVELVEQGSDFAVLRTSEGLMERTNISKRIERDRVVVEVDEKYRAGSMVTVTSHFIDEFAAEGPGVIHHAVVRDLAAPGFLGFLYRKFGRAKMGKAFLGSYKAYFENLEQRDTALKA